MGYENSSDAKCNLLTRSLGRKVHIMSKLTIAGLVSWFIGGLLLGFQALDGLVRSQGNLAWKKLTLMDVISKNYFEWIGGMPEGIVQSIAQYIVTMPLYLLLFCIGILFFILNALVSKL